MSRCWCGGALTHWDHAIWRCLVSYSFESSASLNLDIDDSLSVYFGYSLLACYYLSQHPTIPRRVDISVANLIRSSCPTRVPDVSLWIYAGRFRHVSDLVSLFQAKMREFQCFEWTLIGFISNVLSDSFQKWGFKWKLGTKIILTCLWFLFDKYFTGGTKAKDEAVLNTLSQLELWENVRLNRGLDGGLILSLLSKAFNGLREFFGILLSCSNSKVSLELVISRG